MLLQAEATRTWTEQQSISFLVAHVSFLAYPVTVLQMQRTALEQTSFSRVVLWFRFLRRLDVTVGYTSVRTCSTI